MNTVWAHKPCKFNPIRREMTCLGIWVTDMGRPIVRLAWYRCWYDGVDVTGPFTLVGLLLSWISFSFPFSVPVPLSLPLPLAGANPLEIDISFALMIQFHWWAPTLCWGHSRHWWARTGFTNRGKGGGRGRERRGMWTSSCMVTIAVSIAMARLAFQTIAITFVIKKGAWTRTQLKGHRWAGLSFPISIPIPLPISFSSSVPVPVSLTFTVPDNCAGGEGRPR